MTPRTPDRQFSPDGSMTALSSLPPRDTSVLVRTVRDRLRQAIIFGELEPGSRLNQVQVAEQLGVSRMPVRAASAGLVTEGLLKPLPAGGVAVQHLTKKDVPQAYRVREALEVQAVLDVVTHGQSAAIDRLFAILARHAELGGINDIYTLAVLDREFHASILEATGNPFFARAMVPMWSVVERAMVGMLKNVPDMFILAWKQHRAIAEALRAGEAGLAETHVRQHLRDAASRLIAVSDETTMD